MINQAAVTTSQRKKKGLLQRAAQNLKDSKLLWIMLIPGLLVLVLFKIAPIFGIAIAFQNYSPFLGVFKSEWVGFKNFQTFLSDPYALTLIKNTVLLAFWTLIFSFPIPVVFALFLNEVKSKVIKTGVQTVSFFPYFISTAVAVSILISFVSPSEGLINILLLHMGIKPIFFMSTPGWFIPLYVILSVWQTFGYNAIVYLAAITGIDTTLYEAADMDGAGRWKQMFYVTLPSIKNMIVTMFILNMGSILSVDINKVLMMYNPSIYSTADVLQTYVYRMAFATNGFPDYSLGAAVGLFQSVFAFILVFATNQVSKKFSESAIF